MTPISESAWKTATGTLALVGIVLAGSMTAGREVVHGSGTSLEENKALARRWTEELWGRGELKVADEIIAPDYVRHDRAIRFPPAAPKTLSGS